jgi:activating signal cointegrator complex subunit 3
VESCLAGHLHDHINAEIAGGTIHSLQDCINYLNGTYYYRRLVQNPRFYGAASSKSHEQLNVFVSKQCTDVLNELYVSGCITVDDKKVVASTDLGSTASFYYISYKTVHLFAEKLRAASALMPLIELLCEASEFDGLPVRHNEEALNAYLAHQVPFKLSNQNMHDPHAKAALLLMAYFLDIPFPIADYLTDTKSVLDQLLRLAQGMLEICKNKGYLQTLLTIVHILQMVIQGIWSSDPPLLQLSRSVLPARAILALRRNGIVHLPQLMQLNQPQLAEILPPAKCRSVLREVERFPKVDVRLTLATGAQGAQASGKGDDLAEGEMKLLFQARKTGGEAKIQTCYGKWKDPGWYLVVGNESTNQVIRCVRFTLRREVKLELTFAWPSVMSAAKIRLYLLSDSYIGLDQVFDLDSKSTVISSQSQPHSDYRPVDRATLLPPEDSDDSPHSRPTSHPEPQYQEDSSLIEKDLDTWLP